MRDQEHTRNGPGFNRRDFLKGSGVAVAATAVATSGTEGDADAALRKKSRVVSAKAGNVTLNVNGKDHKLKLEPRVTLLEALRKELKLTGCKDVEDDTGNVCGADTVIVDGKAALAGCLLAVACQGKKILTVESLRDGDQVDEVIAGFVKHDALQCGFCTPGFVMATRAFLDKNPRAGIEEIKKGLGGNLCRCGSYHGITACAVELAKKGGA